MGTVLVLFSMKTSHFALRGIAAACVSVCTAQSALAQTSTSNNNWAELSPITISATRLEQALQTAPVGASVILGDEIRASGMRDANEAVRLLGGVPSRSDLSGGRETSLDLRGYGEAAQQNLVVVIDGIRISENELVSARLSGIGPEMIEKIEILRGGASAVWGEGAAGGVIVVTTRGAKPGLAARATLSRESYNARDAQASIEAASSDGFGGFARLREAKSDGYRDNSANRQTSGSLGATLSSGGLRFRLGFDRESASNRFPGYLSIAQFQANPRQTLTPDDFGTLSIERVSAALSYQRAGWTFALDMAERERQAASTFVSSFSAYERQAASSQTQISPRLSYDGKLGNAALTALIGHDSNQWRGDYNDNFGSTESATQSNRAWYGKLDALLPSNTRLNLAARRERIQKAAQDPGAFTPYAYANRFSLPAWDVAANQTLAPGWDVYARAGKSFRVANVDESRGVSSPLKPMTARDTELGLKFLQGASSAALRVFRQRSVDELAFDPINFVNVNQDAITRRGVELEGRTRLAQQWDLSGSVQFINARFSAGPNVGKRVPLVSSTTALARIGYAFDAQHRLEAVARHRSSALIGGDVVNACTDRAPASTQLDLRYSWKQRQNSKGWLLSVAVDNLTDRKTYSYGFSAGCGTIGVYPEAGRVWRLTAGYSF
jgi:iron complex outermembrane recepter protein